MKFRTYNSKIVPGMVFKYSNSYYYKVVKRSSDEHRRRNRGWELNWLTSNGNHSPYDVWEKEAMLLNPNYYTLVTNPNEISGN